VNGVLNSTLLDTVGTTAVISGSGNTGNTTTAAIGEVGLFGILLDGEQRYMSVHLDAVGGSLSVSDDAFMIAQTVDSQGLTDDGTLSIYIGKTGVWTANFSFRFFEDSALVNPISPEIMLTSLDIDYNQQYFINDSDETATFVYNSEGNIADFSPEGSEISQITNATDFAGYKGFTGAGDSTINNPTHAVTTLSVTDQIDVGVRHSSVALFMFEFRNPPTVIPAVIPEIGSLALTGIAFLTGIIFLRRRSRVSGCLKE
jgi:hypothetical protein